VAEAFAGLPRSEKTSTCSLQMANLVCLAITSHPVKSVDFASVRLTAEFPLLFSSLQGASSVLPANGFHLAPALPLSPEQQPPIRRITLGFYDEMADFAADGEDAGYLGRCAKEIAELFRADDRTARLLIIEEESRRP
jgi:hypothetical protein